MPGDFVAVSQQPGHFENSEVGWVVSRAHDGVVQNVNVWTDREKNIDSPVPEMLDGTGIRRSVLGPCCGRDGVVSHSTRLGEQQRGMTRIHNTNSGARRLLWHNASLTPSRSST